MLFTYHEKQTKSLKKYEIKFLLSHKLFFEKLHLEEGIRLHRKAAMSQIRPPAGFLIKLERTTSISLPAAGFRPIPDIGRAITSV